MPATKRKPKATAVTIRLAEGADARVGERLYGPGWVVTVAPALLKDLPPGSYTVIK